MITVDFETDAIEDRPNYPPYPRGVALKINDEAGYYLSWGHPEGNNCTLQQAREHLLHIFESDEPLLFHNAKFDLAVATEKLDLPMPEWHRIHDTMFLHYLFDPHAKKGGLKEIAEELLDWPPEERNAVADWIWANRVQLTAKYGGKITRAKRGPNSAGAWISKAPGDLVGAYAVGDVDRTYALYVTLKPTIEDLGMDPAYDRERQLLPILMENEREGMRVDVEALAKDIAMYTAALNDADDWLRWRLKSPGLNLNDDVAIAQMFELHGVVNAEDWVTTKSGQNSIAKDSLHPDKYQDKDVAAVFGYRNRLETCLKMFMIPWHDQAARRGDGRVSTNWNQTRNPAGGTRTGRPSTNNPNFLNISKDFEGRPDGYKHPEVIDLPQLPLVRKYILPEKGHVFLHRDFDGQELRVFAHFESGKLHQAYHENPTLDVHQMVADDIKRMMPSTALDRTKTKIINFRTIYGSGVSGLAIALNCTKPEAKTFKEQHAKALPGMKILNDEIKRLSARGTPIRTWGGRLYYAEAPVYDEKEGRWKDFVYKLLNYLVQGSAADLTKEAIIEWYAIKDPRTKFIVTVYDEINISAPIEIAEQEMLKLKNAMEKTRVSVPMLSSGKWGFSWGSVVKPGKGMDEMTSLREWLLQHAPPSDRVAGQSRSRS